MISRLMCDAHWRELLGRNATAVTEVALNPDSNGSLAPASGVIPRRCAGDLSYERFCLDFMEPNLPVILEGATAGWRATQDWVLPDGSINLDYLQHHFGATKVTVTDTARQHKGSGPGQHMSLAAFIAWWRQHKGRQEGDPVLWYCKDWHLALEFPQYKAYTCPPSFQDDWLNEWHDSMRQQQQQQQQQQRQQQRDDDEELAGERPASQCQQQSTPSSDYRFVYLGVRGTSTPLHSDVLRSFSWSANIAGRKLWRLLPPQYSHLLEGQLGSVAWDFFAEDPEGQYPRLAEALPHVLEVVQQPGEAIFVPSGWHHTVENLDDCISINHNWLNGHNVHWTWALLRLERRQAVQGIEDCRDLCSPAEFESLVLKNLGANAGLDYAGFGALLRCTAQRSLACLAAAGLNGVYACPSALSSSWYHAFCLQRTGAVLQELLAEQQRCGIRIAQAQNQAGKEVTDTGSADPAHLSAREAVSPHAAEVAANSQCLADIGQQLRAMGIAADVT